MPPVLALAGGAFDSTLASSNAFPLNLDVISWAASDAYCSSMSQAPFAYKRRVAATICAVCSAMVANRQGRARWPCGCCDEVYPLHDPLLLDKALPSIYRADDLLCLCCLLLIFSGPNISSLGYNLGIRSDMFLSCSFIGGGRVEASPMWARRRAWTKPSMGECRNSVKQALPRRALRCAAICGGDPNNV